jgi:hypothetical protein
MSDSYKNIKDDIRNAKTKTDKVHVLYSAIESRYDKLIPVVSDDSDDHKSNGIKLAEARYLIELIEDREKDYVQYIDDNEAHEYMVHKLKVAWRIDKRSYYVRVHAPWVITVSMVGFSLLFIFIQSRYARNAYDASEYEEDSRIQQFMRTAWANKLSSFTGILCFATVVAIIYIWFISDAVTQMADPIDFDDV